ncbi:MAG: 50S ribosomal protein L25 [Elusimicrobiota bacterium]
MQQVVIEAESREMSPKNKLRDLRTGGKIPAVLYGAKEEVKVIVIDAKKFEKIISSEAGANILVNLKIGSESKTVIVKEIQRDIITQKPIHIDFLMISLKDKIEVSVSLHIIGEAPGVKLGGGILEHIQREVRVKCLPTDIPKSINIDVSKLEINQALHVRDISAMQGVEILTDPDSFVVNIVAPTILEEPAPGTEVVAAVGSAEPEVIKKGKKDEEGEEAAAVDEKGAAKKPEAAKPGEKAAEPKKAEPKK